MAKIFLSDAMVDIGVWLFDILTRRWPSFSLKMSSKETSSLDSDALNDYVKQVMSIPEQVMWFKRFMRTTCPMSSRIVGLNNDLEQLERVSFENLNEVMCPTMVIHGTADTDVPFSNAEFSANTIPNARLYRIENVGHVIWLGEHVSKMDSDIIEFVRESM
jgi:pimeloyl-ACP methyl ester carboxylesterase